MSQADVSTTQYPATSAATLSSFRRLCADLAGTFDAVLVRIWLLGPGDRCDVCPMADRCASREHCLHLIASAGLTPRLDGQFARFPLSAPPMSLVASGRPLLVRADLARGGLADAAWFATHRIASYGVWPIESGGTCAGVLVLFSRRVLSDEDARALGAIATFAASTISALAEPREGAAPTAPAARRPAPAPAAATAPAARPAIPTLADVQRRTILHALEHTGGRVSGRGGAAELLGLKPTTLESRMRRLGVRKPPRRGLSL